MFKVSPADIEQEAIENGNVRSDLRVPKVVLLTFNQGIIDELYMLCKLYDWNWKASRYSPNSSPPKTWKGNVSNNEVAVFIPPMGVSPVVAFCEELIFFGAEVIFLLCASWSLGEQYLAKGEIHLPSFSIGLDGTSPHYGNKSGKIECEPKAFSALSNSFQDIDTNWKEGGVGSCEAFYRITSEMTEEFRQKGCLSMENGETAGLFSLAHETGVSIGVLLQPYIDLEQGWKLAYMGKEYTETCKLQARVALEASKVLVQ